MPWDSSGTPTSLPTIPTASRCSSRTPRKGFKKFRSRFKRGRSAGLPPLKGWETGSQEWSAGRSIAESIWIYAAAALGAFVVHRNRQGLWNRWQGLRARRVSGAVDGRSWLRFSYRAVKLAESEGPYRARSQTWREWILSLPHEQRRSILTRAVEVFEIGSSERTPGDAGLRRRCFAGGRERIARAAGIEVNFQARTPRLDQAGWTRPKKMPRSLLSGSGRGGRLSSTKNSFWNLIDRPVCAH